MTGDNQRHAVCLFYPEFAMTLYDAAPGTYTPDNNLIFAG